ncbi:MAG: 4Fe-4S binding protein [Candidatus Ornithomonoglobus sp.]
MTEIKIDKERCKACGLCENICRLGAVKIDRKADARYGDGCAVVTDACVGCGMCALICPDIAIEIRSVNK